LIRTQVYSNQGFQLPANLQPAPMLPAQPRDEETRRLYEQAKARGRELAVQGKVAAMVVAGGDGTRLGFAGPKGCLPVTPIKRRSLFCTFGEQILATSRRYGCPVPWYIMTSPANDAATRDFFAEQKFFGLGERDVFFFIQGQTPPLSREGKMLLGEKDRIATNPDGHGGSLTALRHSGALEDMARRGIEVISYFQVDNPLVHCIDPLFIGLHALKGAEMSAKALPKREPMEKLGNFCLVEGQVHVIEYSDLPEEMARATRPDGKLLFSAGSIAIHTFSRSFVERLTEGGSCKLPFHRAIKKVPHVGPTGAKVQPDQPNALKFEMFVFDALPLANNVVILETQRSEEFSPVKNATGDDSIATCLHDQIRRGARWLTSAGVKVPRDADGRPAAAIEISPLYALDEEQLAQKPPKDFTMKPGQEVYLG
jgi:UDP-N-acetylglucosamine/UDP-N-acetylgalactosamine diphosphorylase